MKPNREGIWEWFDKDGNKRLVEVFDVAAKLREATGYADPYLRVYWWGGYYNVNNEGIGTWEEALNKAEWPDRWGNFVGEIGSVPEEQLYSQPTTEQMKRIRGENPI